jgi:hypothetical protein
MAKVTGHLRPEELAEWAAFRVAGTMAAFLGELAFAAQLPGSGRSGGWPWSGEKTKVLFLSGSIEHEQNTAANRGRYPHLPISLTHKSSCDDVGGKNRTEQKAITYRCFRLSWTICTLSCLHPRSIRRSSRDRERGPACARRSALSPDWIADRGTLHRYRRRHRPRVRALPAFRVSLCAPNPQSEGPTALSIPWPECPADPRPACRQLCRSRPYRGALG